MSSATTLPGSSGLPFLGETAAFLLDALSFVEQRLRQHGRVFRTHLLTRPTIISACYASSLELLRTPGPLDAAPAYEQFLRAVYPRPNLLLASQSSTARNAAKALLPALDPAQLPAYVPVLRRLISEQVGALRDRARAAPDGEGATIRPYAFFKRMAERAVTTLVLGSLPEEDYNEIRRLCSDQFNAVVAAPVSVSVLGRRSARARGEEGYARLVTLLDRMVGARLAVRDAVGENRRACVLDAVMPMARSGAVGRDDVVEFLLLLLSTAVPKCLASALASLFREARRNKTLADGLRVEGKKAVHCALMETLRLHPPLLGGMRAAGRGEGKARIRGAEVGAEWQVWYSIRHCNSDGEAYKDAESFCAERWRPAANRIGGVCPFRRPGEEGVQGAEVPPTPLTFGAGERHCPGRDVAWLVLCEAVTAFFESLEVRDGEAGMEKGQEDVKLRYFPVLREEDDEAVVVFSRD